MLRNSSFSLAWSTEILSFWLLITKFPLKLNSIQLYGTIFFRLQIFSINYQCLINFNLRLRARDKVSLLSDWMSNSHWNTNSREVSPKAQHTRRKKVLKWTKENWKNVAAESEFLSLPSHTLCQRLLKFLFTYTSFTF